MAYHGSNAAPISTVSHQARTDLFTASARPSGQAAAAAGPVDLPGYWGSDLTSASHFASSRRRSLEDPYFLKS